MATDSSVFLRFSRRSNFSSFSGRKKGGGQVSSICPDPHHLLAIGAQPKKAPTPNAAQPFLSKCSPRQHVWESPKRLHLKAQQGGGAASPGGSSGSSLGGPVVRLPPGVLSGQAETEGSWALLGE